MDGNEGDLRAFAQVRAVMREFGDYLSWRARTKEGETSSEWQKLHLLKRLVPAAFVNIIIIL